MGAADGCSNHLEFPPDRRGERVRESQRRVNDSNKEGPARLGPVARISEGQGLWTAAAGSGRAGHTLSRGVGRKQPPAERACDGQGAQRKFSVKVKREKGEVEDRDRRRVKCRGNHGVDNFRRINCKDEKEGAWKEASQRGLRLRWSLRDWPRVRQEHSLSRSLAG